MNLAASDRRSFSLSIWLSAFLSPTVYFLLLLLVDRFHVAAPPEIVVASLFFLIPFVALVLCEWMLWSSTMTVSRKVCWMLVTAVAMLLQFGILLAIVVVAITAAIGYAQ